MPKRDNAEFKIDNPADMTVTAAGVGKHPGEFIRDVLLPEYGLSVSAAARLIKMDRASFHNVMAGKHDVSHDLAYKLGALMRDEVADLLIAYQHAWSLEQGKARREQFKAQIERLPEPEVQA